MNSNKSKIAVLIQPNVRERLREFQEEHQIKFMSSAIGVILEKYFEPGQSPGYEVEQEQEPPSIEPASYQFDGGVVNVLLKRLDKLETRLVAEEKRSNELEIQLAMMAEKLQNYRQTAKTASSHPLTGGKNDSSNGGIPNKKRAKKQEMKKPGSPQPPEPQPSPPEPEKPLSLDVADAADVADADVADVAETSQAIASPNDRDETVTPEEATASKAVPEETTASKAVPEEATASKPVIEKMTTRQVAELLNWHRDKLEARKKRGNLPIKAAGCVIDCIGKKGGRLIWTVKHTK